MERPIEMWLIDRQGRKVLFSDEWTVECCRELWTEIAGHSVGNNLEGFQCVQRGVVVFEGDYVTDEC